MISCARRRKINNSPYFQYELIRLKFRSIYDWRAYIFRQKADTINIYQVPGTMVIYDPNKNCCTYDFIFYQRFRNSLLFDRSYRLWTVPHLFEIQVFFCDRHLFCGGPACRRDFLLPPKPHSEELSL